MLDITKFSRTYSVRRMRESDADTILAISESNPQYYQYCGKSPSKEEILNDLRITPLNISADAKYYVGFYDHETLIAVMDLIEGYPNPDCLFIGFFMLNHNFQGRQIGTGMIGELLQYAKEIGFSTVRLGIDKGNPQSTYFWEKNGFRVIKEIKQDVGTILLAERTL